MSAKKIKKKFKQFNPFSFQKVGNNNISKLLKNINAKKAMGVVYNGPFWDTQGQAQ